ncbi:tRNA 2-selenouridine(34) synthase MnmH [Clostridium cylindrosporum]|uniref:tRNA 2-selenouridine synthase SelU n=1 Tax=Clostridium cylindrosporum DSM 605 TaxID=1121307 RepID=A0A0J8D467_CLOCY|nr:tRNA 2-selenouridine(34) synthase MnmH [Clostridium cylindrosporum]KMT20975.1 tRNA 2-selenouridine synthase SelU [Clostridium cylindrosporum DSM 605]
MIRTIDYKKIDDDEIKDSYVIIDVRSPKEFRRATIPGAINIPIFSDEEREEIGTVYVKDSVEKAKHLGVIAASKKLPEIYDKIQKLQRKYKMIIFFCERGGMRSSSLVSFLYTVGINSFKLLGGYKAYRGFINENLPRKVEQVRFIVLHGNTGVGKTKLLKRLSEEGFDILDLEGCANNRGSLFGDIGLGDENSQKYFESLVYNTLKKRKGNIVFVEAESKRIGHVIIPDYIYSLMKSGNHININADLSSRVANIMEDYVHNNVDELIEHIDKLSKYISSKNIEKYKKEILDGKYKGVIEELMLKYYDPLYENKIYNYSLEVDNSNIDFACKHIKAWINSSYK